MKAFMSPKILCRALMISFLLLVKAILNEGTSHKTGSRGLQRVSFNDWPKWKNTFANCNPKRNPNLSPINIVTSEATDSAMAPFIVYGGKPAEDCLYLSTIHHDADLEMEVVNIFPDPICTNLITHISGIKSGGSSDVRYFKGALIFFSSSKVSLPQSTHRFDGKSFQMEIAMEFANKNGGDVIKVHVMVEVLSPNQVPANPVFKSIEEALVSLKAELKAEVSGSTEHSKKNRDLKEKCETAEKKKRESDAQERGKRESMQDLHEKLQELNKIKEGIKHITNAGLKKLIKKAGESGSNTTVQISVLEERIQLLQDKKKGMKQEIKEGMLPAGLFQNDLKTVDSEIHTLSHELRELKVFKKMSIEQALARVRKLLTSYKVGIPGEESVGMLFDGPDDLYNERKSVLKELRELSAKPENECSNYHLFGRKSYAFVPIQGPFQISWLFPQSGGYFFYYGSSPIPSCQKTKYSIVFETPIRINTEQLKSFLDLPSLFGGGKIDKTVPVLNTQSNANVLHVSQPPVFIKDDGFHPRNLRQGQDVHKENSGSIVCIKNNEIFLLWIALVVLIL